MNHEPEIGYSNDDHNSTTPESAFEMKFVDYFETLRIAVEGACCPIVRQGVCVPVQRVTRVWSNVVLPKPFFVAVC